MRVYDHDMIVGAGRKPYNSYFIEIVVETDCVSTTWITEKTVKNPIQIRFGNFCRIQRVFLKPQGNE